MKLYSIMLKKSITNSFLCKTIEIVQLIRNYILGVDTMSSLRSSRTKAYIEMIKTTQPFHINVVGNLNTTLGYTHYVNISLSFFSFFKFFSDSFILVAFSG